MIEILSLPIGALITILISLCFEYVKKPNLEISIGGRDAKHSYPENQPPYPRAITAVSLSVENTPPRRFASWIGRNAAMQCRGELTFHYDNDIGQKVIKRPMPIRWTRSPQPASFTGEIQLEDKRGHLILTDPERMRMESHRHVFVGNPEPVDVAIKCDDEEYCWGWNNESYLHAWKHPDFKIPKGRYLVKVKIWYSGSSTEAVFWLLNHVDGHADFRLDEAGADQWRLLGVPYRRKTQRN